MVKTVFVDFDGVLFNTIKESYLLTRVICENIFPHENIDKIEYEKFCRFRYLVTKYWQFYYVYNLIKQGIGDFEFEFKYNEALRYIDKDANFNFEKMYIKKKEKLRSEDYEFWEGFYYPYPFFFDLGTLKNIEFVILTNEKRLPIENILIKYGLITKLYAGDELSLYSSKMDFIERLIGNKSCCLVAGTKETFRDCENHPNVLQILAGWGYINPREKGISREKINQLLKEDSTIYPWI